MASMIEQFFFFVVEKHPWILIQFNETHRSSFPASSRERPNVRQESQMKKEGNISFSALESTLVIEPMDLETDIMDVLGPQQNEFYFGNTRSGKGQTEQKYNNNWSSGYVQNTNVFGGSSLSGTSTETTQYYGRSEHEEIFPKSQCETTQYYGRSEHEEIFPKSQCIEWGRHFKTSNKEQNRHEEPNHIRELVNFKPSRVDQLEYKRKLRSRRRNRIERRNRRIARYIDFVVNKYSAARRNRWVNFNSANNEVAACATPCGYSTPKCSIL